MKRNPRATRKAPADEPAGFTEDERAAMRERARERKAAARRRSREDEAREVLERIAAMPEPDREMALRLHALIQAVAPELSPRLWYGMPAYAREGQVVCFFQPAHKFHTRYATLGFTDAARLDEGTMWPVAFALQALTDAEAERIAALVARAARGGRPA